MLTAMVAHPPRFGATVKSLRRRQGASVPGVVDVVQIPTGVAVLAKDYLGGARRAATPCRSSGTRAAPSKRRLGADPGRSTGSSRRTPGQVAAAGGDADRALATARRSRWKPLTTFPIWRTRRMEPMNCVVRARARTAASLERRADARPSTRLASPSSLGLPPEQVTINTLYAGGSFGRRANPRPTTWSRRRSIAKAIDGRRQSSWSGRARTTCAPATTGRCSITSAGRRSTAGQARRWHHRIVGQSILAGHAVRRRW